MSTTYEPGGKVPDPMIPLCVPHIAGNEAKYIQDCIDTGWVSSVGSYVDRFEQMIAERMGVKYAVATVNGTAALHVALTAGGVEPDDEVLVSTLTFIASANAIRYANAWPVFIDAEPRHWQMDPNLVQDFLANRCEWKDGSLRNRLTGRRVRAIEPVHILGHAVDMTPILELACKYELLVVEDAAEALGTRYKNQLAGGLGSLGCTSFNGNKLITTGGGGMVVTNDQVLAQKVRYLTTQAKDDPVEYIHGTVGYNYRLPNLLAAFGCAQAERLDDYIQAKRTAAAQYHQELSSIPGVIPFEASPDVFCTWWLYTVAIDPGTFGLTSRELRAELHRSGIQTRPLWQAMHASPAHQPAQSVLTGVADNLVANCLSLPCSVGITREQISRVCHTIHQLQQTAVHTRRAA
jgi:perosamine synthetase